MADILIRGMKMPNDENGFVKLMILNDGRCFVAVGENEVTSKTGIVTAGGLPEGHGRLGDLDKLEESLRMMAAYQTGERQQGILGCCETIRMAKSIVPAEGETDNG